MGHTQSNMSAPRATQTTRSSGYPTPITYLGLCSGNQFVQALTLERLLDQIIGKNGRTCTLQNSSFASPPDKPPMAIPGVSRFTISLQHVSLRPRSRPPWIIQNRLCLSGCLWAAMHRSSQRIERCMASSILLRSGEVVAITSSSCITISEPIEFCNEIECSGVSSLYIVKMEHS